MSYNLTEAVGSLSYFVKDYKSGSTVNIRLESTPIAFKLNKGSSLRVDVSSESGKYIPHPNVKGHFALISETKVAENRVYSGESFVDLPLSEV